jgi:hypothetical protein
LKIEETRDGRKDSEGEERKVEDRGDKKWEKGFRGRRDKS